MGRVTLIASGDLRLSANRKCWPAQEEVERLISEACSALDHTVERGHAYDPVKGHGFIDSQRLGLDTFRAIPPEQPIIVACSAWQYSHHVLAGLATHRGPILTVANWSGTWPGLVGMLNLNGSLTKAGVEYSTLWSENFEDTLFLGGLASFLSKGSVEHDLSHVRPAPTSSSNEVASRVGDEVAAQLLRDKAIMGVFDEGCMGMYNAIVPDHLLNATGVYKERLSQSALYYETMQVEEAEAEHCLTWLTDRGMEFEFGHDEETDLTGAQVLLQLRMYIATLRIADDFGCDAVGIQYQQGLKDLLPASDLVEGLLNNTERPPAFSRDGSRELFAGVALPHFNEVDECAGLDALVTNRVWTKLGLDPETTLHDVRWGEDYDGQFVWVFEISGSVPPQHLVGGFAGARSERQPPMYFRLGGGTIKGISKPGPIVWSRIYVEEGRLRADVGLGTVVELPRPETERRWQATTPQWPIMHAVTQGVSRDQLMARHKSNHIQVAYATSEANAESAMWAKVTAFQRMGIDTYLCGV